MVRQQQGHRGPARQDFVRSCLTLGVFDTRSLEKEIPAMEKEFDLVRLNIGSFSYALPRVAAYAFLDVCHNREIYILENNVLLIKGTLIIKGEKATVKVDPEGYQFATIFSKPNMLASLKQKRDTGIDEYIQGFGEKIEYDAKTETAILIGNAQMNQLAGTKLSDDIHADKIHYDGITEKYHAISSEAVKSMLSPRRKDNQGNTQR